MTVSLSHATGMRNLVGVGGGWGRSHCSHTFGARCYGETFFFFAPLADVRRGARLLSPSPGTATHAQLRTPPLRPALKNPPSLGSIDRRGWGGGVLSRSQRQAGAATPGTRTHTHTAPLFTGCVRRALEGFFFSCRSRKRRRPARRAGGRRCEQRGEQLLSRGSLH